MLPTFCLDPDPAPPAGQPDSAILCAWHRARRALRVLVDIPPAIPPARLVATIDELQASLAELGRLQPVTPAGTLAKAQAAFLFLVNSRAGYDRVLWGIRTPELHPEAEALWRHLEAMAAKPPPGPTVEA